MSIVNTIVESRTNRFKPPSIIFVNLQQKFRLTALLLTLTLARASGAKGTDQPFVDLFYGERTLAKRITLRDSAQSMFTPDRLRGLSRDLKSGRLPLDRMTVSDDVETGLRATVFKDGRITLNISYHLEDKRPYMILGEMTDDPKNKDPDKITIEQARELAKTIKYLAGEYGIDVQEGLHRRLVRELLHEGIKWRPK